MIQRRFLPVTPGVLLSLVLLVSAACGGSGSSSNGENTPSNSDRTATAISTSEPTATLEPGAPTYTPGPTAASSGDQATSTPSQVSRQTSRLIRDVEIGARKLDTYNRILSIRIGQVANPIGGTPENPVDTSRWFNECCDSAIGDFDQVIRDIRRSLDSLTQIYQDAGDSQSLAAIDDIAASVANIEASIAVFPTLPTPDTAGTIMQDISDEITSLVEATSNLA